MKTNIKLSTTEEQFTEEEIQTAINIWKGARPQPGGRETQNKPVRRCHFPRPLDWQNIFRIFKGKTYCILC